jgi:hypothetical protein
MKNRFEKEIEIDEKCTNFLLSADIVIPKESCLSVGDLYQKTGPQRYVKFLERLGKMNSAGLLNYDISRKTVCMTTLGKDVVAFFRDEKPIERKSYYRVSA